MGGIQSNGETKQKEYTLLDNGPTNVSLDASQLCRNHGYSGSATL